MEGVKRCLFHAYPKTPVRSESSEFFVGPIPQALPQVPPPGMVNTPAEEPMDPATRDLIEARIQWVEDEMEAVLASRPEGVELYAMQRYHLGWLSATFEPLTRELARRYGGKKLRGVLCLLACEASGGDPRQAIPAAAALEFIHNFSLIHDDLEDEDPERRHRPTVWRLWGVPLAVNAGSNMQALVNEAALRLPCRGVSPDRVLAIVGALSRAMLAMTEGQALDLAWQDQYDLGVDDYLRMAEGKTAALIEAAAWCGAAVATTDARVLDDCARFGRAFGLAFQARDDHLGIWGRSEQTGKPVGADILQGKRSLPIVHALEQAARMETPPAVPEPPSADPSPFASSPSAVGSLRASLERRDVGAVLAALEETGSRPFVEQVAAKFTAEALAHLDALAARGPSTAAGNIAHLSAIAAYALRREE
jgi:geranylgeranyl diphosphate synthase type I